MATASTTTEDAAALLRLMWLASPALPVGAFSYSEGLEAAVEAGLVHDAASAGEWLCGQLELVQGRAELPLVAQAFGAWRAGDSARVAALNGWSLCTRETAELRAQSEQMGRALLGWLRHDDAGVAGPDARLATLAALQPAPTWPIAFALAAARNDAVQARDALLACAFGWAEGATQAALKAVPLGQAAAQRILARLAAAIPTVVESALALDDDARQAFAPRHAILSARHETQYSRLFRS